MKFVQEGMKDNYDKNAKAHEFKVGDKILITTPQPQKGLTTKLKRPFKGPFIAVQTTPTNLKVKNLSHKGNESIIVHANRCKMAPTEPEPCKYLLRSRKTPEISLLQVEIEMMPTINKEITHEEEVKEIVTTKKEIKYELQETWKPNLSGLDLHWIITLLIILSIPSMIMPKPKGIVPYKIYSTSEAGIHQITISRTAMWFGPIEVECRTSKYIFLKIMEKDTHEIICQPLDDNTAHEVTITAFKRIDIKGWKENKNIIYMETRTVTTLPEIRDPEEPNRWMKYLEQ
jgi:hypothetical protein